MNNKWEHIRAIAVAFICVFGLVTCAGVDKYYMIEAERAKARKAEADQRQAEATLELEKLKRRTHSE